MFVFVNLGLKCWDIVYKLHVFEYFYLILHKNKLYLFIRVKHAIWKYLHEHTQVCIINKWMDFTFLFFIPTNLIFYFLYPTQRVAEGMMFLTRPSVSQSVSPVFLVSATPLKPLNRISWNFVVMKDIMCRCAYPQEILIPFFLSELRSFWT